MNAAAVRRFAYRLSAVLALAYVVYVVALKLAHRVTGGPLGELGEFFLVLACVTAFAVGLFADEALRRSERPESLHPPTSSKETT
jgi:hypothetical protein